MITAKDSVRHWYRHEYCVKTDLELVQTCSLTFQRVPHRLSNRCQKQKQPPIRDICLHSMWQSVIFPAPNLDCLSCYCSFFFFYSSKNHLPLGQRACFQLMWTSMNCEDFDPGTVDEQQQQDVLLMQKMFSRPLRILETTTQARPLIHLRHGSHNPGLERSVSARLDISEGSVRSFREVTRIYISAQHASPTQCLRLLPSVILLQRVS